MRKPKILFNIAFLNTKDMDGFTRYAMEILHRIDKSKFIFIANENIIKKFNIENYIKVPEKFSEKNSRSNFYRFIWYQYKLRYYIHKYDIKAFYSPIPEGVIYSPIKQFITIHDIIPIIYPQGQTRLKYYYKYVLPYLIKKNSVIITVSQNSKRDISRAYNLNGVNIFIAPSGFDIKKFYPCDRLKIDEVISKYSLNKEYILYTGAIRIHKNVKNLIKAFYKSKLFTKNIELVIVGKRGNDKFSKHITNLVKELNIENNIKFIDFVSDNELACLYSGALAFVFPSLYEGFGAPPLEAMACGTPVVVSNVSSLPEVCGDAALYVDPQNVNDIAQKLVKITTDYQLRDKLIKKGFEQIKNFSWDNTVKILENLLKEYDET